MSEISFERIDVNAYQLAHISGMKADAVFYVKEEMLPQVTKDRSLSQLAQTAMLPRLVSPVVAMPDMHEGYGIPVGGIMVGDGLVSAGCVGMDINCGVRLLTTGVEYNPKIFTRALLFDLIRLLERAIPIGLGGEYKTEHPKLSLGKVVLEGSKQLAVSGYATDCDIEHTEEEGCIQGASVSALSDRALQRARRELGTLGSGNHFMELERVTQIFEPEIAETFGLIQNQLCFMIHSGSRALGHQTCLDYVGRFFRKEKEFGIEVPNRELASLPVESDEGSQYLSAMNGAINFAFANRQMMTDKFRSVFTTLMKAKGIAADVRLVYDVAHNSAKWEIHRGKRVLVHRKGATRALPAGHADNPRRYAKTGHPAFVPGNMATGSYVLVGTPDAVKTYYSVNHGAGRAMSRTEAKKTISQQEFEKEMGEVIYNKPFRVISDEAPAAYKDLDLVIRTLEEAGVTRRIARLEPLMVVKGD